ncbi:BlaI/MecI/CopY family transcriptional regulator [Streptomyces glomeratus]|nr:BlaI/MecI/CopY family transcriptional regulator [Streptomyces glomeratus]MCF1506452.1 BlaI/MecI/CopY family transcriptional regulator [Streptomyces glomeratus]
MPRPLGELEDTVMTRVWKWNRPVTVREVLEDLQQERSIAYTTVMTVLDNLHQKGWVRREAEGRAYRYEAVSTRAAYAAALMNDAWSQSDNPAAALVAFFGMMSDEQRQALQDAMRIVQGPASAPEPADTETASGAEAGGAESTPPSEAEGDETASAAQAESPESVPPSDRPAGSAGDKPGGTPRENPA